MEFPDDLLYSSHDEWTRREGDVITLGITDFAQDALGELVHIELPEVGDVLAAGDVACEVESVKAVAEVYSPVDGEVIEVNEALEDEVETVNEHPYSTGWLLKIRVTDDAGLSNLMNATAYRAKIED